MGGAAATALAASTLTVYRAGVVLCSSLCCVNGLRLQKLLSCPFLKHGSGAAVSVPPRRRRVVRPPQLPIEGENSSFSAAARANASDALRLRHRPGAYRAAGRLSRPHCDLHLPWR